MLASRNVLTTENTAVFAPRARAIVRMATVQAAFRRARKRSPASRESQESAYLMVGHATTAPTTSPIPPFHSLHDVTACGDAEERPEALDRGVDSPLLGVAEAREQRQRHDYPGLLQTALPRSDQLAP